MCISVCVVSVNGDGKKVHLILKKSVLTASGKIHRMSNGIVSVDGECNKHVGR